MKSLTRHILAGVFLGGVLSMSILSNAQPGKEDLADLEAEVSTSDVATCEGIKAKTAEILEARYLGLTREEQMDANNHLFMKMITVEAYDLPVYDGQTTRDTQIEAFSSKWQEKCLANPEVTK